MIPPETMQGATPPQPVSASCGNLTEQEIKFDRRDYAAMALLALGLAVMFWKVLFTSQMFFYRDVYNFTYPHIKFIHDACRHGYLPYWNPLLNYGEPVLANPNFLFFYPFTLLIILLPVAYAYCLHYVVHFAIAALGAYWLARQWNQSRWAALFAASAFAFSGPLLSLGNFYNHAACAAWIPWALLLTDKAVSKRSLRPWILLTAVFSLQFLAGEMLTLLATFVLCLAYAIYRGGREHLWGRANGRIIAGFVAAGLLMMALCAVELLPASHLLANSRRGLEGLPYRETTYWSFNPLKIVEFALPNFYGDSLNAPSVWDIALNARNNPYFLSVFLGFIPLFFAGLGLIFGREQRKKFAAYAAGGLLLLSFGRFTPVFALAYLLFPPLDLVRFPVKLLTPFALLVALLAGWGIDAFRNSATDWARRRRNILIPIECLLGITILLWILSFVAPAWIGSAAGPLLRASNRTYINSVNKELTTVEIKNGVEFLLTMMKVYLPGFAGFLLGSLVWLKALETRKRQAWRALPVVAVFGILRLAFVNYSVNPTVPKIFYTYAPPVLKKLEPSETPYRVCNINRLQLSTRNKPTPQAFLNFSSIPAIARLSLLAQNDFRSRLVLTRGSMLAGVETVVNNDIDLSFPLDLFHFWIFDRTQMPDASRADRLLGRTNVKYEIFDRPQKNTTLQEVGTLFNGSVRPSYLYLNLCAAPRAYVASSASYSTNPLETLTRLSVPRFDIYQQIILPTQEKTSGAGPSAGAKGPAGTVKLLQYQPNTVILQAEMGRPGYVVLLDRYAPDWHAKIDGRAVPLLRANLMFRAVLVKPGNHLIRFEYHQQGLKTGLFLTLMTMAFLIAAYRWNPAL